MKISINCPSYKRPKVKTLKYLPYCKVWVEEAEADAYRAANKGADINILGCKQGNVSRVRNYILDREFADGADVVCIVDDDLRGLFHFEKAKHNNCGYERHKLETEDFEEFIYKYSVMARDLGAYLWGVNLNMDARPYRHSNPFSTASVILGPFSCHLKGSEIRYDERLPLKEDYDLALQHLNKHRKILRVNKYYYICKQSQQAGGCAAYRNYESEKAQFELLQRKWGKDIVRLDKASKKNNYKIDYNPIIQVPIKGV